MSILRSEDLRRVSDASVQLATMMDGGPPALATFVPEFRRLLGMDVALAFGVVDRGDGLELAFMHGYGVPMLRARDALADEIRRVPDHLGFDPRRPERRQRNVPLTLRDVFAMRGGPPAVIGDLYYRFGIAALDQLRVLVCDGPAVLAWVGGFREAPFGDRDRRVLGALVPALARRLRLERDLGEGPLSVAALSAALEALGTAAFVIRGSGAVVHANEAGRELLRRDRQVAAQLRERVKGVGVEAFDLVRLEGSGIAEHHLALLRRRPVDTGARAAAAARRWRLTRREVEVLSRLARGEANKEIAAELGCAPNTVEVHVSALLERFGCESRTRLVARFWTET